MEEGKKKKPGRNGGTLTPYDKGVSGNPKGRPKNLFKSAIQATSQLEYEKVVREMFRQAQKGNVNAFKALSEIGYGKDLNLGGQEDNPVNATLLVNLTDGTTADGSGKP
jgi:hypothetical protein